MILAALEGEEEGKRNPSRWRGAPAAYMALGGELGATRSRKRRIGGGGGVVHSDVARREERDVGWASREREKRLWTSGKEEAHRASAR